MRIAWALIIIALSYAIPVSADTKDLPMEGKATYYHKRFHGRKCASGDIYNKEDLVAAHPSLPFGTFLRVTNLKNNQSVIVRVIDRCPKRKTRLIDLSERAAKELSFIRAGVAHVRIEEVDGPADMRYLELLKVGPIVFDLHEKEKVKSSDILTQAIPFKDQLLSYKEL